MPNKSLHVLVGSQKNSIKNSAIIWNQNPRKCCKLRKGTSFCQIWILQTSVLIYPTCHGSALRGLLFLVFSCCVILYFLAHWCLSHFVRLWLFSSSVVFCVTHCFPLEPVSFTLASSCFCLHLLLVSWLPQYFFRLPYITPHVQFPSAGFSSLLNF